MSEIRYVDLAGAEPDEAVVVIDVLRAFTVEPWLFARGVTRLIALQERDEAVRLRDEHLPTALLAGEQGGRPLPGFDLGNSPTEVANHASLDGATVLHRTSAGTQGLVRTIGSGTVFAASFVTAGATALALRELAPSRVTFVITGASLGRDGDEDLAAAELIAARFLGEDPDVAPLVARVATSDAGRMFAPGGPDWAPPSDLIRCSEVDRFDQGLVVTPASDLPDGWRAVEVHSAG
ncbi:MAG: 2-phosphosulfolactate phosphatase [Nitriliruptoraceae bacterium]